MPAIPVASTEPLAVRALTSPVRRPNLIEPEALEQSYRLPGADLVSDADEPLACRIRLVDPDPQSVSGLLQPKADLLGQVAGLFLGGGAGHDGGDDVDAVRLLAGYLDRAAGRRDRQGRPGARRVLQFIFLSDLAFGVSPEAFAAPRKATSLP